jgi:RNA:NAD 2'-phosphotransferase (TPT1/KptA family)
MRMTAVRVAAKGGGNYLYHYTSREAAGNILKTGLTVTEKRPLHLYHKRRQSFTVTGANRISVAGK